MLNELFFLQNDSELFGRTLRVNIAKPLRIKENSTRPVWADEEWLQTYSGKESLKISNAEPTDNTEKLEEQKNAKLKRQGQEAVELAGVSQLNFKYFFPFLLTLYLMYLFQEVEKPEMGFANHKFIQLWT